MKEQNLSPDRFLETAVLQTIQLHNRELTLYVPDSKTVQEAYQRGEILFPYWSKIWPAAIALSNFILLHPHYIKDKKVVELGAGLGLPSLVVANSAATVMCTDYSPEAVQFAQWSAKHNNLVNMETAIIDWHHLPEALEADVVMLSDVNYEPAAFDALMKMIDSFLSKGSTILLATPQRLMAKNFIAPLLAFCTLQQEICVRQNGQEVTTSLLVIQSQTL